MSLSWDAAVSGIIASTGCTRERAETAARGAGFAPPPSIDVDEDAVNDVDEKKEQLEITKVFRAFGIVARNLSQARRSKQAPGLPDLYCTHATLPIAFWWESKRQVNPRWSDAQREFQRDCERCNVGYGTGDRHAARRYVIELGLARAVGDTLEPIRREDL